jgi:hypothetical protein
MYVFAPYSFRGVHAFETDDELNQAAGDLRQVWLFTKVPIELCRKHLHGLTIS